MPGSGFVPLPTHYGLWLGVSDRTNRAIGSKPMSDRLFRLMERHQKLDDALRRLQARRLPVPFEGARLKKLMLAIKDRLARLTSTPQRARD